MKKKMKERGFNHVALITENWMTYAKPFNIKHLQLFFKNF